MSEDVIWQTADAVNTVGMAVVIILFLALSMRLYARLKKPFLIFFIVGYIMAILTAWLDYGIGNFLSSDFERFALLVNVLYAVELILIAAGLLCALRYVRGPGGKSSGRRVESDGG